MRFSRLKKHPAREWLLRCRGEAWSFRQGQFRKLTAAEAATKQAWEFERDLGQEYLAIPTGVDWQVHLRFPGQEAKETLLGGLYSALDGGFDTILSMPNTRPFLDDPVLLAQAAAEARSVVRKEGLPLQLFLSGAGTKGMQGMDPADITALAKAGAAAITDDGWGVKDAGAQELILRACADNDLVFLQHAETPGHKGVASPSAFQRTAGVNAYPEDAESSMVARDLAILKKVPNARYHVLHVSTRKTLELVRKAKADGLRVTAEVSPHHLFFCNEDIPAAEDPRSTFFKMNPPLFARDDREALREALRDGTIDFVATDHAPHELEAKRSGWALSPFGTRGLETALPALVTLMEQGLLSYDRLVEVFSTKARSMIPAKERKASSGVVFVNPKESYTVGLQDLPGISENSCFLGARLQGRVALRIENDGSLYEAQ